MPIPQGLSVLTEASGQDQPRAPRGQKSLFQLPAVLDPQTCLQELWIQFSLTHIVCQNQDLLELILLAGGLPLMTVSNEMESGQVVIGTQENP